MRTWQNKFLVGSPSQTSPNPTRPYSHGHDTHQSSSTAPRSQTSHGKKGEALYNVPVLSPEAALDLNSKHRPSSHGRSFSHPFPSILSRGRGATRKLSSDDNNPGNDNVNDRALEIPPASTTADVVVPLLDSPQGRKDEPEHVIGRCATCDSKLRWPRGIFVFRCTVCLMINDLQPARVGSKSFYTALIDNSDPGGRNPGHGKYLLT